MDESLKKIIKGYQAFRERYVLGDDSIMQSLASKGQKPQIMVVACCDSRVDPALILQCDPGDLFVVRNVANIIPPYEKDESYHGTSAALEFGICHLNVKNLIILGHSQCGGIEALSQNDLPANDFITKWVTLVKRADTHSHEPDSYAKVALTHSYHNCLKFPWIKERVDKKELQIHLWFFNIKDGEILTYSYEQGKYLPLGQDSTEFK